MVKYALKANTLGDDTKGCIAVASAVGAATLDDVIGHMITEGTGLTRPQAQDSFDALRHRINVRTISGIRLSRLEKNLSPVKIKLNNRNEVERS